MDVMENDMKYTWISWENYFNSNVPGILMMNVVFCLDQLQWPQTFLLEVHDV